MPELPDVEGFRRAFAEHATGRTVREVTSVDSSMLRDIEPVDLADAVRGRRFDEPDRVGKLLICGTDGPTLLLHFGMTGSLRGSSGPIHTTGWSSASTRESSTTATCANSAASGSPSTRPSWTGSSGAWGRTG